MQIPLIAIKEYPNQLPSNIQQWLTLLKEQISKQRQSLSVDKNMLQDVLKQAIELNALSIKIPHSFGGTNLSYEQQYYYYREMSRASGTVAFLLTQHSTALGMILNSLNEQLKEDFLHNKHLFAIAFSHLREMINPPVTATETASQFIINGNLRYVTGYKFFDMLLFGFVCGNKEVFTIIPFVESKELVILTELDLATAKSSNTISCQLINYPIDKSMIVSTQEHGTIAQVKNGLKHIAALHLGIILAIMDLISSHKYMQIEAVQNTYNLLITQIQNLEDELILFNSDEPTMPIRIKIMVLLNKIFLFADQIFKGSATLSNSHYLIIKKEAGLLLALGSTVETLVETCKIIDNY